MDLELQAKRAIVTGGSRGIGRAVAREQKTADVIARRASETGLEPEEVERRMGNTIRLHRLTNQGTLSADRPPNVP
jgi:NAD(P)-dependent dehydrogenase (short-subunit alcohol dehydrogenase family)